LRDWRETYGRPFVKLLHHSVRQTVERKLAELIAGRRERFTERVLLVGPDGMLISGEMTAVAVPDPAGQVDTVLVLIVSKQREHDPPAPVAAVPQPKCGSRRGSGGQLRRSGRRGQRVSSLRSVFREDRVAVTAAHVDDDVRVSANELQCRAAYTTE